MCRRRSWLTGIVVLALLCGAQGLSTGADDAAQSQVVNSQFQELNGKVLYPDGKTPATNVSVKVERDLDSKIVHETATDDKGAYKLPKLPAGKYKIIYGDRVIVNYLVVAGKEPVLKFLNVLIPRGVLLMAGPKLDVVIAALAGGAIATAVVIGGGGGGGGGNGGGHSGPVSP